MQEKKIEYDPLNDQGIPLWMREQMQRQNKTSTKVVRFLGRATAVLLAVAAIGAIVWLLLPKDEPAEKAQPAATAPDQEPQPLTILDAMEWAASTLAGTKFAGCTILQGAEHAYLSYRLQDGETLNGVIEEYALHLSASVLSSEMQRLLVFAEEQHRTVYGRDEFQAGDDVFLLVPLKAE